MVLTYALLQSSRHKVMALFGAPASLGAASRASDPEFIRRLELFVSPAPPERLKFVCIRPGGPLSPASANPVCRGANQRTTSDVRNAWSDLPSDAPASGVAPAETVDPGDR